jgi:predicted DNA-binding transcriptional regulator AlpA
MAERELWGVAEIAKGLGLKRAGVYYHINRPGFPEPVARLAMGSVWDAQEVREWREGVTGRPIEANHG